MAARGACGTRRGGTGREPRHDTSLTAAPKTVDHSSYEMKTSSRPASSQGPLSQAKRAGHWSDGESTFSETVSLRFPKPPPNAYLNPAHSEHAWDDPLVWKRIIKENWPSKSEADRYRDWFDAVATGGRLGVDETLVATPNTIGMIESLRGMHRLWKEMYDTWLDRWCEEEGPHSSDLVLEMEKLVRRMLLVLNHLRPWQAKQAVLDRLDEQIARQDDVLLMVRGATHQATDILLEAIKETKRVEQRAMSGTDTTFGAGTRNVDDLLDVKKAKERMLHVMLESISETR